jgi:hypothetical protein
LNNQTIDKITIENADCTNCDKLQTNLE